MAAAVHMLIVPVAAHGQVLCIGEDGHVAISSKSQEMCCTETVHGAVEGGVAAFQATPDTAECGNCIDVPLPCEEERQPARQSKNATDKSAVPTLTSTLLSLHVSFAYREHRSVTDLMSPACGILAAVRTVTLLI